MEQFQYHMRQYEEGRLQLTNDDDDEEYGKGICSLIGQDSNRRSLIG